MCFRPRSIEKVRQVQQMELLQQIIELDKKAAASVEQKTEEFRRQLESSDLDAQRTSSELIAHECAELDDYREKQERVLKERLEGTQSAIKQKTDELDAIFDRHRQEWQDEILQRITGA